MGGPYSQSVPFSLQRVAAESFGIGREAGRLKVVEEGGCRNHGRPRIRGDRAQAANGKSDEGE